MLTLPRILFATLNNCLAVILIYVILTKLQIDYDGIQCSVETCSSDQNDIHFILFSQYSRKRPKLDALLEKQNKAKQIKQNKNKKQKNSNKTTTTKTEEKLTNKQKRTQKPL